MFGVVFVQPAMYLEIPKNETLAQFEHDLTTSEQSFTQSSMLRPTKNEKIPNRKHCSFSQQNASPNWYRSEFSANSIDVSNFFRQHSFCSCHSCMHIMKQCVNTHQMDCHLYFVFSVSVHILCISVCTVAVSLSDRTTFSRCIHKTSTLCAQVCKFVEQMLCKSECQQRDRCKSVHFLVQQLHMPAFSVIKFDFIPNFPYGNLIYASHQASKRWPNNLHIQTQRSAIAISQVSAKHIHSTAWNTKVRFRRFIWECIALHGGMRRCKRWSNSMVFELIPFCTQWMSLIFRVQLMMLMASPFHRVTIISLFNLQINTVNYCIELCRTLFQRTNEWMDEWMNERASSFSHHKMRMVFASFLHIAVVIRCFGSFYFLCMLRLPLYSFVWTVYLKFE